MEVSQEKNEPSSYLNNIFGSIRNKTFKYVATGLITLATLAGPQTLADKKSSCPLVTDPKRPKDLWKKVLVEGEKLHTWENAYQLENKLASTVCGTSDTDRSLSIEALFLDQDYNNKVSPPDSGRIIRRENKPKSGNRETYSEMKILDKDPTDMKAGGSSLQRLIVHSDEKQAKGFYQQFIPIFTDNKKMEARDFWKYVKEEGNTDYSGEGKVYSLQNEESSGNDEKEQESGFEKSTQVTAKFYDNGDEEINSGDVGVVTFETLYSHGDGVQMGPVEKIIDNSPVNFEGVTYERSLGGDISLEGDVAKKLFTLFTKELESD